MNRELELKRIKNRLERIANYGTDSEKDHAEADELLREAIITLGYIDIADEYEIATQWRKEKYQ